MWQFWLMCKALRITPSQIMGFCYGTPQAFYFDRAIWIWATKIEQEMAKAEQGCKKPEQIPLIRRRVLDRFLLPPVQRKMQFKDPGAARPAEPKPKPEPEQDVEIVLEVG